MTEGDGSALARLRAEFDRAFAEAPRAVRRDLVPLLAIRAGGEAFALRVLETGGLMPTPRVVAVPGARPELLGVAGLRGAVLPVFSLARLLGRADGGEPRWTALAGSGADRVGLAFEGFDGHVVVPAERVRSSPGHAAEPEEIAEIEGGARPVLRVGALLRAVAR